MGADVVENIREQDKEIMDLRKADPKSNEAVIKPPVPYMDIDGSSIQPNTGGYTSPALLVRPFDSSLTNRSPTRSPSFVRKPLPINEPKPVLPKSKHLKTEAGSSSSSLAIIRASVIEEENSSGESIEKQKCSDGLKRNQSDGLKNVQDRSSKSESIEEANKKTSVSTRKSCPMSPRLPTRNRPSTLMLDKRERVKRSSAVSATPSTDSSKSSKTFEFIEYDSDTREKILEAAIREEDAFLEFVKSLNIEPDPIIEAGNARDKKKVQLSNGKAYTESKNLKPPTPITSVGQENLDSLCRMMEEILMLRDENNKLQERLQYMEVSSRIPPSFGSLEELPGPSDLPEMLNQSGHSGLSTWLSEESNRNKRCKSVGTESQFSDRMPKLEDVSSPRTKAKLSKWSKVKEAFKWERSPSEPLPSTMSTFDESTTSELKHKFEIMISSSSEELPSEIYNFDDRPYEIYLPRSSSVSDCYNNVGEIKTLHDQPRRHSLTSFDEKMESHEEYGEDGKANKSTWYKVKNMIYTRRESLKKKTNNKHESERSKHDTDPTSMPLSTASDYEFIEEIADIEPSPIEEISLSRLKRNSMTPKSQLGEKSKPNKFKRQTPPELVLSNHEFLDDPRVYSHSLSPLNCSNDNDILTSKKLYLSPKHEGEETSHSLPSSPNKNSDVFFYDDHILLEASKNNQEFQGSDYRDLASQDTLDADNEIQRNYEQLKRSLSEEFNKKMSGWGQKKTSRDGSDGRSIDSNKHLSVEFRKKLDEWQKRKRTVEASAVDDENEFPEQHTSKDKGSSFGGKQTAKSNKIRARPAEQKTLQEDDLKPEFKLKVAEWEVRKAMAGHSNKTTEEITKLMPEDFNKKLKEWEQIKEGKPNARSSPEVDKKTKKKRKPQEKWVRGGGRKYKEDTYEMTAPEVGTFAWLDKELMKVEREKQRLEREKLKYEERQARLTTMREALCHQPKKEITVKTAAGEEFKFEGINQKFTKKLYEWENRRGIAPESSTITLLQTGISQNKDQKTHGGESIQSGSEKRSKSAGRLI